MFDVVLSVSLLLLLLLLLLFIVPLGFLKWEIPVALPRKSQLRQSRATQPMVHAGCFSASISHRTLTRTTRTVRTDVNARDCTRGCTDTGRESELESESGRKIPRRTGESYLRQWCAAPTLHQLSYNPAQSNFHT